MHQMFRHIHMVSSEGDKEFIHSILSQHLLGSSRLRADSEKQMLMKGQIRELSTDFKFYNDASHFNEQVLGPELSKKIYWTSLLSSKMKYLLPATLVNELKDLFFQLETAYYSPGRSDFSSAQRGLLSFMRALAGLDIETEVLIFGNFIEELDSRTRSLIMRCLTELSSWMDVYIPQQSLRQAC